MPSSLSKGLIWTLGGILLLSALFQLLQDHVGITQLAYHRTTFYPALYYQWITPSLVHAGWMHWLFNVLNLLALVILFASIWSVTRLLGLFALSSALILLCLYHCSPTVTTYVGMSGVLYALVTYSALLSLRTQPLIATAVLLYVLLKLFAHDWINRLMGVDVALGDMRVITDVHWYGAGIGVVVALIHYVWQRLHKVRLNPN